MKKISLVFIPFILMAGCEATIEQVDKAPVPVQISSIRPDSISQFLKLTGGIEALDDALVYSKVSETAEYILVKPGDTVRGNQTLAVQTSHILQQGMNLAQASVENAETQYAMARQDYERMQRLFRNNAVSQQQCDQSETQYKAAQAMVKQAEAQLEQAREQYQNSIIKSPFAGTVAMVLYEKGQMVPAGQPVVQIVNDSQMKAKLFVPALDISLIRRGQNVIARFPAIPDTEFAGHIERINGAIDPVNRTMEIEVRIENTHPMLKSGMFGQFLIETQSHSNTIVLPDNVILSDTEVTLNPDTGEQTSVKRYYVYTVEGGAARLRQVEPGLYSEGRMEIVSGLSSSDSVIVMGQNLLKDNTPVTIVHE